MTDIYYNTVAPFIIFSFLRGWVNVRIAILDARLYSRMIRGACLPSTLQDQEPDWDLGSGLGLAQYILIQNSFLHTPAQIFLQPA